MSNLTDDTYEAVTVNPVAERTRDENPPAHREIRVYMMPQQEKMDYIVRIAPLTKRYHWQDNEIFDAVERMGAVYMHGTNARTVSVDGMNILESDYENGFKTQERLYNIDQACGKPVLHERISFGKEEDETVMTTTEKFSENKLSSRLIQCKKGTIDERFDPETGFLRSRCSRSFDKADDIAKLVIYEEFAQEKLILRKQYFDMRIGEFDQEACFDTDEHFTFEKYDEEGALIYACSIEHGEMNAEICKHYAILKNVPAARIAASSNGRKRATFTLIK